MTVLSGSMQKEIADELLALNRTFYSNFARSFSNTRLQPNPGFHKLITYLPENRPTILDLGCGNGRLGKFLFEKKVVGSYVGVDFSEEMLRIAKEYVPGDFWQRDLSAPGALRNLGYFDAVISIALLQHIPSRERRVDFLRQAAGALKPRAKLILSTWQFLSSSRQRRKIVAWNVVGIDESELEEGDYLMSWQRNGSAYRYVNQIDEDGLKKLAVAAGLKVVDCYYSDGQEGDLNLYSILEMDNSQ